MVATWLVELESAEDLVRAVRRARAAGCTDLDTLSPFPVTETEQEMVAGNGGMLPTALLAGLGLGALTYAVQAYTAAILYPIDVGGRPLHSWPAFLPASIAVGLLGAGLGVVARMLVRCGLPRLHNPLFELPAFERASIDRFFLALRAGPEQAEALRAELGAQAVHRLEGDP